jgi:hypothetical protein
VTRAFDLRSALCAAAAAAGVLGFRAAGAAVVLQTEDVGLWALPRTFSWPAEIARAAAVTAALYGLLVLVLGRASVRPAARCLLPLALPALAFLAVPAAFVPMPRWLLALAGAPALLLLGGLWGVLWCAASARRPAAAYSPRRWEPVAVFALVAALLCALASQISERAWLRQAALTGDEPEYVLTAISLLDDGDILLRNNSQRDDAREFGAAGFRFPLPRPVHNIGVPLLIAPAYALGRLLKPAAPQRAVWYLLALVSALLAAELYALCQPRGRLHAAAAASIVLLPPMLPMTVQIYPEMPAAWLAVAAYRRLGRPGTGRTIAAALAIAALPWLHVKLSALAFGLLLASALRPAPEQESGRTHWRRLVPGALALAGSLAALSFFSAVHYGSFLPTASYGKSASVLSTGIVRGTLGLLFDQSFGLIVRAPVLLVLLPGLVLLARRRPSEALGLLAVAGSLFAIVASYHMWWGGWSPPGRFVVPIAPFLLLAALEAAALAPASRLAGLSSLLWLLSLAVGLRVLPPPPTWMGGSRALAYQDSVEPDGLCVLLSQGWDLCASLPRLVQVTPREWALGVIVAAAALLTGLGLLSWGRRPLHRPASVLALALLALAGGAAALDLAGKAANAFGPAPPFQHARNQAVRQALKLAANPDRYRVLARGEALLPAMVQLYEAEALRGNHLFFEDRAVPEASGGIARCATAFDPAHAPIPITFRYPSEFVPWPAGTYGVRFRLLPPPEESPVDEEREARALDVSVVSPYSECLRHRSVLARRELTLAEVRDAAGGRSEIDLRFQLRCLTPKLEWLVEAHGQRFCLDRIEVVAEAVHVD